MEKFVEVLLDKKALIARSQSLVTEKIEAAIAARTNCTLALAGGSTPKPLYEALSEQALPWESLEIFWGDERYVSPDHPNSNQKMARQAWLDRVEIPESNIHPIPTASGDPNIDAEKYEVELEKAFQADVPIFDIILLGMGDDGHTASLFPHTEAIEVQDKLVTVGNKDGQPRLTFTVPLINSARCVIFLVAGANKRSALAQIFSNSADSKKYPACLIQPQGELWWLLDQEAGADLA